MLPQPRRGDIWLPRRRVHDRDEPLGTCGRGAKPPSHVPDAAPTGAKDKSGAHSNPMACAMGYRMTPLPRLKE